MNTELVDILLLLLKYLRQDDDGVKYVLTWVYDAIMQVEADAQAGCAAYERSGGRRLHRNGYKQRGLTTLYGDLVLKKPQFREEGFKTIVFEAYSRVEKALLIVVGVGEDGYRQVLGARVCESENEEFWTSFFEDLKRRGLYGVMLIISDGHRGIKKAVQNCFLGCSWQYCQVHFVRNVLKKMPVKRRKDIAERIRGCREEPNAMMELSKQLAGMGFPEASRMIDQHYKDLFNYMAFPKPHWTKIRTTNLLENTNRKLKQRSNVVGAFPNNASLLRLAGTLLMDREEEWKTGYKLIDLEENPINETGPIIQITAKY